MENNKICNDRKIYIQVLRCMAAYFVILNHVNVLEFHSPLFSKSWYVAVGVLFVSKVAVPIFLLISGGLLLGKREDDTKYFGRIRRWIIVIFLFASLYYFVFNYSASYSLKGYIDALFGGATIAYWYLYLYLGILILMPFLQKISSFLNEREMKSLIFISIFIGGGLPLFSLITGIRIENTFLDALFSPYLGLLFCGYYLENYFEINKKNAVIAGISFCIIIIYQVFQTTLFCLRNSNDYLQLDNRIYITITLSGICVYIITKYMFSKINLPPLVVLLIDYLGNLTLGIFLLGDLFLNVFWHFYIEVLRYTDSVIATVGYAFFVYLVSSICTAMLKKVPLLKKLI